MIVSINSPPKRRLVVKSSILNKTEKREPNKDSVDKIIAALADEVWRCENV